MSRPYLLVSDIHAHDWSQFATLSNGINSRLEIILDELSDAINKLVDKGGNLIVCAGDIFHKRGTIFPPVFNPVFEFFADLPDTLQVQMICGNHDCITHDSEELGSAIYSLGFLPNIKTHHRPFIDHENQIVFCPWRHSRDALLKDIEAQSMSENGNYDLVIHAGICGVLPHLEHGFNAQTLRNFDFKRVLSGHFHNAKDLGGGIYSVGALTHQTFGDIGTKAGFLLVYPDHLEHYSSLAPKFIDVDEHTDKADIANNYCRLKLEGASQVEADKARTELLALGAQGVIVSATPKAKAIRAASSVKATMSLQQSVQAYIDDKKDLEVNLKELGQRCEKILEETLAV